MLFVLTLVVSLVVAYGISFLVCFAHDYCYGVMQLIAEGYILYVVVFPFALWLCFVVVLILVTFGKKRDEHEEEKTE